MELLDLLSFAEIKTLFILSISITGKGFSSGRHWEFYVVDFDMAIAYVIEDNKG